MSPSIPYNFCLKHFFVSIVFFQIFRHFQLKQAYCMSYIYYIIYDTLIFKLCIIKENFQNSRLLQHATTCLGAFWAYLMFTNNIHRYEVDETSASYLTCYSCEFSIRFGAIRSIPTTYFHTTMSYTYEYGT